MIFAILFIKPLIYKETQKTPEITMRQKRTVNTSIFDLYSDHEIGLELKAISAFLDRHPEVLNWVSADLQGKGFHGTGLDFYILGWGALFFLYLACAISSIATTIS